MKRRRRPTIHTVRFHCPRCGYTQKGYFNRCPTPGCHEATWRQIVAEGKEREANAEA